MFLFTVITLGGSGKDDKTKRSADKDINNNHNENQGSNQTSTSDQNKGDGNGETKLPDKKLHDDGAFCDCKVPCNKMGSMDGLWLNPNYVARN